MTFLVNLDGVNDNAKIQEAYEFARQRHEGQVDKSGQPYIEHPVRVAELCEEPIHKIIALLHDVVEDTDTTIEEIHSVFGSRVGFAVEALTHLPNEPRLDYLARVHDSRDAWRVKLADITDNLGPDRLALLDEPTRNRLMRKYHRSLRYLLGDHSKVQA